MSIHDIIHREKSQLNIAVAFDKNYHTQFFVLAASLFDHHPRGSIVLHAMAPGLNTHEVERIKTYVKEQGQEVYFYTIEGNGVEQFVLLSQWTSAVYYRLYFPFLLPESIVKFLYLDVDTVVVNSLFDFFGIETEAFPVAAVYDNYVRTQPLIGIHEEGEYFNSGVLLINRNEWLNQHISEKAIEYLKANPEKIRFVDQCGLNAVLYKNWLKIGSQYNLLYSYLPSPASMLDLKKIIQNVVVVHFTLERPWQMLCRNRLSYLYFHYLEKSPAADWGSSITDFSLAKLPAFFKIKFMNLYFDLPFLGSLWRKLKPKNQSR